MSVDGRVTSENIKVANGMGKESSTIVMMALCSSESTIIIIRSKGR